MSTAEAPQCLYSYPSVRRASAGRSHVRYRAACKCGWTFEACGSPGESRAVRTTAHAEAMLHYLPLLNPGALKSFRQLIPACFSQRQVEWLIDLVCGFPIQSPAYVNRGKGNLYRSATERSFQAWLERLHGRGAMLQITPGPRGGKSSATYSIHEAAL